MPCYKPIQAYRGRSGSVTFKKGDGISELKLACGQCIGCRLERSRRWAVRCIHEASLHEQNSFLTLTYNDKNLPHDNSLVKSHFQKFMKRLRKKFSKRKIKYYMCGEYGDENHRPHYHVCLFNMDFEDKILFKEKEGIKLYISMTLEKLWGMGHCTIGELNFQTAAYTARYVMKKITGKNYEEHYRRIDPYTGEIYQVIPEYNAMSNGIGKGWYHKYKSDCYPSDFITSNGKKFNLPRYYDELLRREDEQLFERVKSKRVENSLKYAKDQKENRLIARETVAKAKVSQLKRKL